LRKNEIYFGKYKHENAKQTVANYVLVRLAAKSLMKLSNCIATVGRGIRKVVIENEFIRKPKRKRRERGIERDYH